MLPGTYWKRRLNFLKVSYFIPKLGIFFTDFVKKIWSKTLRKVQENFYLFIYLFISDSQTVNNNTLHLQF